MACGRLQCVFLALFLLAAVSRSAQAYMVDLRVVDSSFEIISYVGSYPQHWWFVPPDFQNNQVTFRGHAYGDGGLASVTMAFSYTLRPVGLTSSQSFFLSLFTNLSYDWRITAQESAFFPFDGDDVGEVTFGAPISLAVNGQEYWNNSTSFTDFTIVPYNCDDCGWRIYNTDLFQDHRKGWDTWDGYDYWRHVESLYPSYRVSLTSYGNDLLTISGFVMVIANVDRNALLSDAVSEMSGTYGIEFETYSMFEPVVPVPPTVWLFGSGLVAVIAIARRKTA